MKKPPLKINRRRFLGQGARGAGLLAVAGISLTTSARLARAASAAKEANPFAYDLDRVSRTDPKLIRYEAAAKFSAANPDPRRIALGPEDRLHIAGKNGVTILNLSGGRLDEIVLPGPARCVAVAPDGAIYAGLRDHIEVFDRKGQRTATWESPGKKVWLTGLAANENEVFAADAGNRVVLRYDRSGKVTGRIGEKNKERNVPGLIVPSPYLDVALGRDGLLRVNNPGRHCIEVYTTEGDLELSWGKPSAAIEGFCGCCNPIAVGLLPDGRYITCEKGLPRVKVYSVQGQFECVVAGPESFPENAKTGAISDKSDGMLGGLDAIVDSRGRICILDLVTATVTLMKAKA